MKKRVITNRTIKLFGKYLKENEKATATIEKYMRDIRLFAGYAADRTLDKEMLLDYKRSLGGLTYPLEGVCNIRFLHKIRIFRDLRVKNNLFFVTFADFTASPERVAPHFQNVRSKANLFSKLY